MDFELNQALTCRIQTKDSGGLTGESTFMIYINDINEVPTDLAISELTFDENIASGSAVAILSTTDQDTGDTHTYSLVSGDGDVDNSLFTIESNQLKIVNSPDYENKDSYSIRLQTKDSGGLTFEKSFNFSVNDLNEIDYDFNGDNSVTIEEDAVIGVRAMFGTFPGDALINNALNNESSKSLLEIQQEMSDYFQDSRFDRDADGIISPFTDGIQMIREIEQLHLGGEAHFF